MRNYVLNKKQGSERTFRVELNGAFNTELSETAPWIYGNAPTPNVRLTIHNVCYSGHFMLTIKKSYLPIIGFFVVASVLGASLAWIGVVARAPVGGIGAVALVGWAILARQRWQKLLELNGSEPSAPERLVWHRFSGCLVIWGHMVFALLNPQYDLHVGSGNYLAIDNWTLIFGVLIGAALFRGDAKIRDERDDRIDAVATSWGYGSLIAVLLIALFYIGFRPDSDQAGIDDFFIANLMMSLIFLSAVVRQAVQLFGYARDREPIQ